MTEETKNQHRVTVSKDSVHASSEPRFIVQVGECFYLTLAVWEYDPAKATNDQHRDALRQVADAFSAGTKVEAAQIASGTVFTGGQHNPPPPAQVAMFSGGQSDPSAGQH